MPAIGVLLGLALASKWVAAYAIGALALLLLVRSALGRVVAILGLIAITSVLGYIAISVPEGQGFGNVTFLLIMVGLTLTAVVVAVTHPDRLDRRRTVVRADRPGRRRRGRLLRRARDRAHRHGVHARPGHGHAAPAWPSPCRPARSSWRARSPSAGGWATDRWPPHPPGRPARPSCRRPTRRRPTGCGPGWLAGLPVAVRRGLPCGHPPRGLRRLVHPVGDASTATSCGPACRPATPARRCSS